MERLTDRNLRLEQPLARFEEEALVFYGPDDVVLELVARAGAANVTPWEKAPVPRGSRDPRISQRHAVGDRLRTNGRAEVKKSMFSWASLQIAVT